MRALLGAIILRVADLGLLGCARGYEHGLLFSLLGLRRGHGCSVRVQGEQRCNGYRRLAPSVARTHSRMGLWPLLTEVCYRKLQSDTAVCQIVLSLGHYGQCAIPTLTLSTTTWSRRPLAFAYGRFCSAKLHACYCDPLMFRCRECLRSVRRTTSAPSGFRWLGWKVREPSTSVRCVGKWAVPYSPLGMARHAPTIHLCWIDSCTNNILSDLYLFRFASWPCRMP